MTTELQPRVLGKTGITVPPIVFGATSLGNLFRAVPEEDKAAIVAAWVASGQGRLVIDTAGKYGAGLALEVIGRELRRLSVSPEAVLISNKLGWRRVSLRGPEPTFEPGAWVGIDHDAVQDISYDGILRCWEEGNGLLGEYQAELVSVHDPDEYLAAARSASERKQRLRDIVDAYRALCELREQGAVRGVGVGAKDWRVIQELDRHLDLDWVMVANSLTVMHHPAELVQFISSLAERSIGVINSALFHGGFLLGGDFFDYRKCDPTRPADQERLNWRDRFQSVCREVDWQPFDVGVAFGKSHPGVSTIALSSSRAERIATHIAAAQRMPPSDLWAPFRAAGLIAADYPFV